MKNNNILKLEKYWCYIELNSNNEIVSYAMLENWNIDKKDEGGIVTHPQNQEFLNEINSFFWTNFKMLDFEDLR